MSVSLIGRELRGHIPFTMLGSLSGVLIFLAIIYFNLPRQFSQQLFWTLHPLHVLLSALATTGMYRLHSEKNNIVSTIVIGYTGSIFIATLSDSFIPYLGEYLLDLPNRGVHIGFIEKWWLVNPLALLGIAIAFFWPRTRFPHAGHVLLSTYTSLFHIMMALGTGVTAVQIAVIALFLFLAVWIPCCTSDIVFPLLFSTENNGGCALH
ncbi:MAG: hypothetical protein ACLFN5_07710 [bacterium]